MTWSFYECILLVMFLDVMCVAYQCDIIIEPFKH